MKRPAAFFPIVLALGAIILAPRSGAQAQGAREGPIEIEKCQTINKPGSYKLVNNLTFTGSFTDACLLITSDFVTIDLAGFTISGSGVSALTAGIRARASTPDGLLQGLAVRNGSISRFGAGVDLSGDGSIVEGLRVFGGLPNTVGISATGIVKGNTVVEIAGFLGVGTGISATGVVTGNYAFGNGTGFDIGQGSTVIGNTTTDNVRAGLVVSCPSNVTDNTATGTRELGNLVLNGEGCKNTNNVAP